MSEPMAQVLEDLELLVAAGVDKEILVERSDEVKQAATRLLERVRERLELDE
jgi:hypothetical protein